jgi:hypothetical protein
MLRLVVAFAAIGFAVWHSPVRGHEVPADVIVRALVKPEGASLGVIVRVPLESMRDVVIPTRDSTFLDMTAIAGPARTAAELWVAGGIRVYENGEQLARPVLSAVQISLPSDRSFESWEQAVAHVQGPPLPIETELVWTQAQLDVLLRFEVASEASAFALETDFARLGLRTRSVIRFLPPDGTTRVFEYQGDAGMLHLDPRWHQAARRFIESGIGHILGGTDHLLFLLCLVVPVRRVRSLVWMVTAFTVAHSITLVVAATGFVPDGLWFPPFVETLIALSIVWMALENIVGTSASSRRWVLTFAFGLVHGMGFSFALRDSLQFGGTHFVTSLVAFNVGVELGQLAALLVLVPALAVLFRYVVAERIGGILISAIVAHQAWHWMMERGADLWAHDWPLRGPGAVTVGLRLAIVVWVVGGIYWFARKKGGNEAMRQ